MCVLLLKDLGSLATGVVGACVCECVHDMVCSFERAVLHDELFSAYAQWLFSPEALFELTQYRFYRR